MKKVLTVLLSFSLLISTMFSINLTAYANEIANGTCGASGYTMTWSLDSDGTLTISGSGQRMADYYTGSNNPPWYSYKDSITSLVVEDGVINLGAYAFAYLTNLKTVDFGTIDTIGNNTFEGCTSLEAAILPNDCTWIWANAFNGCTSLKVAYVNAVNSYSNTIPTGMFNGCTSLAVLELGSSISSVGDNALKNVSATIITSSSAMQSYASSNGLTYTDTVTGVVSDNTYSSTNLTYSWDTKTCTLSFTGSGDMNYYDNGSQPWYIFTGAMKKVDFSGTDAKTSISTTAFQGREAIESIDFTNIYAIGWGAFAECTNLGTVSFDSTLEAIWNYAFANDTNIDKVLFSEGTLDLNIHSWAFNNCSGTTYWINLPANTRTIDDHAFYGTGFNYVTISSSNVTLGDDAFGDGTGGYARFFGVGGTDTGVYSWVKSNRENNGYTWYYYCANDNHTYTINTVSPTCTEKGYDLYLCPYCDADSQKSNYIDELGHKYEYNTTSDTGFVYKCSRCNDTNLEITAIEVYSYFLKAVSTVAGEYKYLQSNYDARADINLDGVINGKDYILISKLINNIDTTDKETTIDTSTTYQTIDGFGASAAWWSQTVGDWDNAEDIIGLLYDEDDGIGLDIYRYNLGAGSRDINDTTMYIDDERTNCFLQSDGTYNWDNDSTAMRALDIACSFNENLKITLFSNSAPVYLTDNNKAYLTPDTESNLSSSNYQAFADFTVKCAEHFIDEGYNVTEVSPINEPEWGWTGWYNSDGSISCNQEGCHWTYSTALDFYNNYMVPALKNSTKLNGLVGLSVWESGQMDHSSYWDNFLNNLFSKEEQKTTLGFIKTGTDYASKNSNIRSYVDSVDVHSYWADSSARQNVANDLAGSNFGQSIRCTEYCQMYNDYSTGVIAHINAEGGSTNGMTIDYGLAMADIIYQDLTIENAIEWDWWTAVGRGVYTDSLIYVNNSDHSYETSKRLWCLGNYSKFIDVGATRVAVSTGSKFASSLHTNDENIYTWTDSSGNTVTDKYNYLEESAYLNPDGSVVVVYINNSDTTEYTSFDSSVYDNFTSYVTDTNRNLEQLQSTSTANAACIPARSVTTIVLTKGGTPVESTDGAYLFAYFTGNTTTDQKIHFAVSEDGYNFEALNNNEAVITQTLGTQNCRDPYIFQGQDGYYYIVATDMDASTNVWWGNSSSIIYWRSKDLVNWSDETLISMYDILADTQPNVDDIQRFWAPQVLWDENEQKYFVYFSMASWTLTQNVTRIYYCYTDDLLDASAYSDPQLLYTSDDDGLTLDGDIIYDSKFDTYYLYFKDEEEAKIYYVSSKNLTGPYSNLKLAINSSVGLEGCNSYFITGTDTLVMMADAYGDGYFVMNQSTNFNDFYSVDSSNYSLDFSPRHGSVIPISTEQYNTLKNNNW